MPDQKYALTDGQFATVTQEIKELSERIPTLCFLGNYDRAKLLADTLVKLGEKLQKQNWDG